MSADESVQAEKSLIPEDNRPKTNPLGVARTEAIQIEGKPSSLIVNDYMMNSSANISIQLGRIDVGVKTDPETQKSSREFAIIAFHDHTEVKVGGTTGVTYKSPLVVKDVAELRELAEMAAKTIPETGRNLAQVVGAELDEMHALDHPNSIKR